MKIKNINKKGFGLIEIILVITVGMSVFLGIEQYLSISLKAAVGDSHQTEALYLAKANLEQARAVRDEDWDLISPPTLALNTFYHFDNDGVVSPDKWITAVGSKVEGRYTVWFTTSEVERDGDDNIVASGSLDAGTIKINSNVSWLENGATKSVVVSEYLTNFK